MKRKVKDTEVGLEAKKSMKTTNSASEQAAKSTKFKGKDHAIEKKSTNDTKITENKGKGGRYEKPLAKGGKMDKKNFTGNTNGNSTLTEKPDWLEIKKQRKELKVKRKASRLTDIYDVTLQAKQLGEKLRRSDCTPQKRKPLIAKVHGLMEGHYDKLIFTHDMSRIIQWVLKYCEPDTRQAIFNELEGSLLPMIESKYAKNCVKVILKHGSPEIRSKIVSSCYGNVVKLLCHSVSSSLLEVVYLTWATDTEKTNFKQEFYGDMYKESKDKTITALPDVFRNADAMKSATLSAVKGNLVKILNKKLLNSSLVQTVLWEFLNICSAEDKGEMIVMLRESIVDLSKTKIGTKVAAICIWSGTNKDRKLVMKALKDNVKDVAMSEHGYMVLLALFDSVDDTVLVKKIILSEILSNATEIALNEYGKHVILYLVARRNSHYFPPSVIEYLSRGDGNDVSKKPADIREKELRDSVLEAFLEALIVDTAIWMSSSSIAMVTLATLKAGSDDTVKRAFKSVSAFIVNSESKIKDADAVEYTAVEHPGLHMILKKLIQHDKELCEKEQPTFGEVLVEDLTTTVIEKWIEFNRACFLMIFLMENEAEATVNILRLKLKPVLGKLKSKTMPGAKILLKKLR